MAYGNLLTWKYEGAQKKKKIRDNKTEDRFNRSEYPLKKVNVLTCYMMSFMLVNSGYRDI